MSMKRRSHNPEDRDALRETIIRLGKRVSEENYRTIFDSANDAIIIHDKDTGDIIDVNER